MICHNLWSSGKKSEKSDLPPLFQVLGSITNLPEMERLVVACRFSIGFSVWVASEVLPSSVLCLENPS